MQVSINLQLQGSLKEVGLMLAQLGELFFGEEEFDEDVDGAWWTAERAAAFVEELTDTALQALAIIAEQAPKVSFRDVQQGIGMTGVELAGRLSSIGFALKRHGAPFPFVRDYYQRVYLMDEKLAALFRSTIATEFSRREMEPRAG